MFRKPSSRHRSAGVVSVVMVLLVGIMPTMGMAQEVPSLDVPTDPWDLPAEEQDVAIPPCDTPPCAPAENFSGGAGGFIPVAYERVLDTSAGQQGPVGNAEPMVVEVGGRAGVPTEGVKAVALSVTGTNATEWTSITVWPTGSPQPETPSFSVETVRPHRNLVIVPLGDNGTVSVYNSNGLVDISIDVLGWFAGETSFQPVVPARLFDSDSATGPSARLGSDEMIDVTVAGVEGIPTQGVGAVVLNVSSDKSTGNSAVTLWPAGAERPSGASLTVEPSDRRDNVVIVSPGTNGKVSVHNGAGNTGVSIDVVGWLPAESSYRPVAPAALLGSAGSGERLAGGEEVGIVVTGRGGVPAVDDDPSTEDAHSVVLQLTATAVGKDPAVLTVWPSGDPQPNSVSLLNPGKEATISSLTVVRLGEGTGEGDQGWVSIAATGSAMRVTVEVVGWFANPTAASEFEVPETTNLPESNEVAQVVVGESGDATVVLRAGAEEVKAGEHLVLGVTPATPGGMLAFVESVETNPDDGSQIVTTSPAMLEDVFPQGDILVDLAAADPEVEILWTAEPAPYARQSAPLAGAATDGTDDGINTPDFPDEPACSAGGLEIDFGPSFNMEFRVKWRWFKAPRVTALATIGAQARIMLDDVALECGWDVRLMKATVTFTAGPVPVVVVFEVGASLDLKTSLSGIYFEAWAEASLTIGVLDNRGYVNADASYGWIPGNFNDLALQARHLTASAMVDVWLDFRVLLYGVIGPSISVGPFVETSLSTEQARPWFALDLGLAGKIALRLDLWFKKWNWTLYEAEIPLADIIGLAICPPVPYENSEPCAIDPGGRRADGSDGGGRVFAKRIRLVSSRVAFSPLGIVVPSIPDGRVGDPFEAVTLGKTGLFSGNAIWEITGNLPEGMVFDVSSGTLSGTPNEAGNFPVTVKLCYSDEGCTPTSPAAELLVTVAPVVPGVPTGVLATAGNASATVTWTAPADDGGSAITGYTVTASPGGNTCSGTVPATGCVVSSLTNGTAYTFTVHATNVVGDSAESVASAPVTPSAVVPGVPTGVLATAGNASATVTWTAPADDGGSAITGYTVTASPGGNTCSGTVPATGCVVSSLTNGTAYTFTVHATNVVGDSAESVASAPVTPAWCEPEQVAEVGDDGGTNQLRQALARSCEGGTIILPPGEYDLVLGELTVDKAVTLVGLDSDSLATIDARGMSRVFNVETGGQLALIDVIITGGSAANGGGVLVQENGSLALRGRTTIRLNHATIAGGGVALAPYNPFGGPILTMSDDSSISENTADSAGGGVFGFSGEVTLDDRANITANFSGGNGGGMATNGGTITLHGFSAISDNTASESGGGVEMAGGSLYMDGHTTISNNTATTQLGGGIFMIPSIIDGSVTMHGYSSIAYNTAGYGGGGISVSGSLIMDDDASITRNASGWNGGGVFVWSGDVSLNYYASITNNIAAERGGGIAIIWAGDDVTVTLGSPTYIGENVAGIEGGGIYLPAGTLLGWPDNVMNNNPDDLAPALP